MLLSIFLLLIIFFIGLFICRFLDRDLENKIDLNSFEEECKKLNSLEEVKNKFIETAKISNGTKSSNLKVLHGKTLEILCRQHRHV